MKKIIDIFLLLIFCATLLYMAVSVYKIVTTSAPDFQSFYFAAKDFVVGENAYLDKSITYVFIYPAVSSLFYLPFAILPYQIAQGLFVILSAIAVPLIVFLSLKLIYQTFSWRHFIFFVVLTYWAFPTKFTLGMGQVNLLALLVFLLGFMYLKHKEVAKSGITIAIAFLMKPVLGFLFLFLLLKKKWKTIWFFLLTIAFFLIFSLLLYGYDKELYYLQQMLPTLLQGESGRDVYYNQGLLGFFSRQIPDLFLRKIFTFASTVFLIGISWFLISRKRFNSEYILATLLTLLVLVHSLSWQHYFVFLIFPFIFVVKQLVEKTHYLWLGAVTISYVLVSANIKDPSLFSTFPVNLFLSHTFFGGLLLLFVLWFLPNKKGR